MKKTMKFRVLFMLFLSLQLFAAGMYSQLAAQGITISGTVVDHTNDPLPGVNVIVKGTTNGTITDANGVYSIPVPNRNAVLAFSYIGFITQEIPVGQRTVLDVTLVESAETLEEVVVIGYGTVRKSDLTGSVVSISSDKFKNLPQSSTTQILQGKAAGVNITSTSGYGETTIRIRGNSSISKTSEPLWVVDGVIGGSTGNVNDIQSIEVLKDASATAIYGSQGANGVILVTTKRAAAGKTLISFDTRLNWRTMRKKIDMMDANELITAKLDMDGSVPITAEDLAAYRNGTKKGNDWYDIMTRTGFGQTYLLNISGGNDKTRYKVSATVDDDKGQWITVTSRGYNVKMQLDSDLTPWMNLSSYINGGTRKRHNSNGLGQFGSMLQYSPLAETKVWDDKSQIWRYPKDVISPFEDNPLGAVYASYDDRETSSMTGFADLKIKLPIDGLTLSLQGLYSQSQEFRRYFNGEGRTPGAVDDARDYTSHSWNIRNINNLTYMKEFGDHRITATGVLELYKYEWSELDARTRVLAEPGVTYWGLENGTTLQHWNKYENSAMVSAFGRVVYSYQGKYLFTGTYRADAPSQFKDKYKWGYFPSAAIGWNVSEEGFMNKDVIQNLKVRASAGITGNHGVGAYASTVYLTKALGSYGTSDRKDGIWLNTFGNPDIRWEKTTSYDVGFDLSILKQRLNLTVDWYYKKTDDCLFLKPLAPLYGGGEMWVNQGRIDNDGWEFTLNAYPARTNKFIWESTLTASYNNNVIKDLAGEERIEDSDGGRNQYCFTTRPGLPMASFWLNEFVGFNEVGNTIYLDNDNNYTTNPQRDERRVQGCAIPKWTFGWNNQFAYKNWDLNIFMRGTGKFYRMNIIKYYSAGGTTNSFMVTRESYYKRWDKVADKSKAEYCAWGQATQMSSTQWLEMAQFLRMQNITLGYRLPKSTARIADVHLAFTCENLFVLTGYSGLDPETVSTVDTEKKRDQNFGLDYGAFPIPRTFTFTLRFDF